MMQMSSTPPPAAPPAIAAMLSVDSGVVGGKHWLVTTPFGHVHDLSAVPQFILHWSICADEQPSCRRRKSEQSVMK